MKRDMDLVRDILLRVEQDGDAPVDGFPGHSEDDVLEHIELVVEAKLLAGEVVRTMGGGGMALIERLTWDGHDYLDEVRDATVWAKTKKMIAEKGGGASFAIVKALASRFVSQKFGLDVDP